MALLGQVVFPFRSPRLIHEFLTAWIASVGWMDCPPVSPGGGSEVPEALLEPGVGAGLTWSPWCRWAAHRERARGGAKPGGAGRESGRGGDGGRSQLCSGDPHCGWEGTGSMAGAGRRGAGGAPGGGRGGVPRCPLGGRRGGLERPLRALLTWPSAQPAGPWMEPEGPKRFGLVVDGGVGFSRFEVQGEEFHFMVKAVRLLLSWRVRQPESEDDLAVGLGWHAQVAWDDSGTIHRHQFAVSLRRNRFVGSFGVGPVAYPGDAFGASFSGTV